MWRRTVNYVTLSTLLHAIWLYSVYDLSYPDVERYGLKSAWFTSQYHGLDPPAARVVIYAVQGLSVNHTFQLSNEQLPRMPFVRSVIHKEGRWGVGHGMMYKPTADTTNMIHLTGANISDVLVGGVSDNILNASSLAWVWSCHTPGSQSGSETIKNPNRVHITVSSLYSERRINCSRYNSWVSNNIQDLFLIESNEESTANRLSQTQSLYLVNMDVTNCMNIDHDLAEVDRIIDNTTDLINSYFRDQKTSFLLLGVPPINDSISPFIAWGAGIKRPRSALHGDYRYHDNYEVNWNLDKLERIDLSMADIAPLVATLLGIRIPYHSNGIIPYGYIHYNKEFVALAMFANARQLMEQVRVMEEYTRNHSLSFMFRPFSLLNRSDVVEHIETLIKERKLQSVIEDSLKVIQVSREAVLYFSRYGENSLKVIVLMTFLGWIVYTIEILLKEGNINYYSFKETIPSIPCIVTCIAIISLQYYTVPSLTGVYYYCLPCVTWDFALRNISIILNRVKSEMYRDCNLFVANMVVLFGALIGIELLFLSLVHSDLWLLLLLSVTGILVPVITLQNNCTVRFALVWLMISLLIGTFPLYQDMFDTLLSTRMVSCCILVLLSVGHVYVLCCPLLKHRFTTPRIRVCSSCNITLIDMFISIASCMYILMSSVFECSPPVAIGNIVIVTVAVFLLPFGSKSVPGHLLHISTQLYIVFCMVNSNYSSSPSCLWLLTVLLLIATLYIFDLTHHRNVGVVNDTLWSGIFACLCYSEFPSVRSVNTRLPKVTSINDVLRSVLLVFLVVIVTYFNMQPATSDYITLIQQPPLFPLNSTGILLILKRLLPPLLYIYCIFNVMAVKVNTTLPTVFCSLVLLMDVLAVQVYLIMADSSIRKMWFVSIVVNSLFSPMCFLMARAVTGNSIVPRKNVDKN